MEYLQSYNDYPNITIYKSGLNTLIEEIDVMSSLVVIDNNKVTITPLNPLPNNYYLHVNIDEGAFSSTVGTQELTFAGLDSIFVLNQDSSGKIRFRTVAA